MSPDELGHALADCVNEATVDDFERNSDDRADHKWESMKDFGNVCWVYRELILSALATRAAVTIATERGYSTRWSYVNVTEHAAKLLATWTKR